jgi:NAD(P)-dependent dehydrogenase (short-subunit alcohol dehydrogenase family)
LVANLYKPHEIKELFKNIEKELHGLDVLVNNAAVQNEWPLMDMPEEDWDFVLGVNLKAPFLCGQHAARMMRSSGKGGKIINISSVHSQAPRRHYGHYSSAKGGLEQLTRCMALEWADYNIQAHTLTVGAIATELTPPDRAAALADAIPAKRVGNAEEVARLIAFLSSDACDYLTGESITIDGGITLGFCANRRDL